MQRIKDLKNEYEKVNNRAELAIFEHINDEKSLESVIDLHGQTKIRAKDITR